MENLCKKSRELIETAGVIRRREAMKVYIDFDDVLCETAEYFTKIAKEMFGIDVPYRQVQFFNLQKSFDLNDEQYEALMKAGHLAENLVCC